MIPSFSDKAASLFRAPILKRSSADEGSIFLPEERNSPEDPYPVPVISMIESLTKRVYGVFEGLGDEQIERNKRRFRVTYFWRIHYRIEDDHMVLLAFGPHDMDGIG